jgi:hypothetical protein
MSERVAISFLGHLPIRAESTARPYVQGACPACKKETLFLGSGGFVTCSWIYCPNPTAAHDLLDDNRG